MHRVLATLVIASAACRDRPKQEPPPVEPPPPEKPASPRLVGPLGSSVTDLAVDGRWVYSKKWRLVYGGTDRLLRTSIDDGHTETVLEAPGMIGEYAVDGGVMFWTRERVIAEPPVPGAVMMRTDRETQIAAGHDPDELERVDGGVYYADDRRLYRWRQGAEPQLVATTPTMVSGLAAAGDQLYVAIYGDDGVPGAIAALPLAGGALRQLAVVAAPSLIAASRQRLAWVAGGRLAVADLDGKVIKDRAVGSVQALVVEGARVFFLDGIEDKPEGQLLMIAEDGSERVLVPDLVHAGGMAIAGADLYWGSAEQLWTMPAP